MPGRRSGIAKRRIGLIESVNAYPGAAKLAGRYEAGLQPSRGGARHDIAQALRRHEPELCQMRPQRVHQHAQAQRARAPSSGPLRTLPTQPDRAEFG
jgi:hypothetical protein